jgi:GTP-binding protein EngB required for normal cell division
MIIKSAEFVISNTNYKSCPQDGKPEYAFIGRSNVGKSSLINMLTNRKRIGNDIVHSWQNHAYQSLFDQR